MHLQEQWNTQYNAMNMLKKIVHRIKQFGCHSTNLAKNCLKKHSQNQHCNLLTDSVIKPVVNLLLTEQNKNCRYCGFQYQTWHISLRNSRRHSGRSAEDGHLR